MANKKVNKVPEKVGEELRNLGLTPEEAGWDCHGTYVLLHKALEKVAASKGIKFDEPKIINADISAKEVVVLVTGHMDDKSWAYSRAASSWERVRAVSAAFGRAQLFSLLHPMVVFCEIRCVLRQNVKRYGQVTQTI